MTSGSPLIAASAGINRAGNAMRRGKLGQALASIPADTDHWLYRAYAHDLLGHIHLAGGDFAKAVEYFRLAYADATTGYSPLAAAGALRHIALATMWYDPDRTLEVLPEAREINEALGEPVGLLQCDVAEGLAWAWKGDFDRAEAMLADCTARRAEPQENDDLPWLALVLLHAARGDHAAASAAADQVRAVAPDSAFPSQRLTIAALWTGRDDLADFTAIEWYDDPEASRERWMRPLERMRSGLAVRFRF